MDRDGNEDDDRLVPETDGSVDGTDSAARADGETTDLTDPEALHPDAYDVEAAMESAADGPELADTASNDSASGDSAVSDSASGESALDDSALDEGDDRELAVAEAGAGRSGSTRRPAGRAAAAAIRKDAPTRARDTVERANPLSRIGRFLREVVAELRKVIWPSRKQMTTYTVVVIVFLVVMVALVSGMDLLFHLVVGKVLG